VALELTSLFVSARRIARLGALIRPATLCVLEIDGIKSVPYTPVPHPFIERLIGTIRREYLDRPSPGTPWTWHGRWESSERAAALIGSPWPSPALRQHNVTARPPLLLVRPTATLGSTTVGAP